MKISTKGRYAVRVMLDLALHNSGEIVKVKKGDFPPLGRAFFFDFAQILHNFFENFLFSPSCKIIFSQV